MKRIVILKHGGGELANQLWNYVSIYAFSLERQIPLRNPSFFEYHSFFKFLPEENIMTKCFSFFFKKTRRRANLINRIARFKYNLIVVFIAKLNQNCLISSENNQSRVFYLPPTKAPLESKKSCHNIYFTGWLFRNPIGLEKYRHTILKTFEPKEEILKKVENIINHLREKFENVVGVHIRQADYEVFKSGEYFIGTVRVRQILEEYTKENNLENGKTVFVITSDGPIKREVFDDLNIFVSDNNAVTDLFLLSKTEAILGSDSSFGGFASYYGNIPLIVMKKTEMDWEYYRDKKKYFENKYCTTILY